MATKQYTDGTYLDKVQDWHVGDSPWKAAKVLRMIAKHDLAPKSVFDVGCGAGEILRLLQKGLPADVELHGFDISPQAIALAKPRENARLRFHEENYLDAHVDPPDLLLLLDVFEHIPDYLGFLERLSERARWVIFHIPLDISAQVVLRKSGYMLHMRRTYGHLHYFTRETALATLADTGFEVVDHFYTDDMEIDGIPRRLLWRMVYGIRKVLFWLSPARTAALFNSYNLMVLARGKRGV